MPLHRAAWYPLHAMPTVASASSSVAMSSNVRSRCVVAPLVSENSCGGWTCTCSAMSTGDPRDARGRTVGADVGSPGGGHADRCPPCDLDPPRVAGNGLGSVSAMQPAVPGRLLGGRYRLLELLARGGM